MRCGNRWAYFLSRLGVLSVIAISVLQAQTSQDVSAAVDAAEVKDLSEINAIAAEIEDGAPGIVPVLHGFNASLGSICQHDSIAGWISLVTPNVAYRFNRHVSANVGTPLFLYADVYTNVGTTRRPKYEYTAVNGVPGDTALSLEGDATFSRVGYIGTFTLGMPTGNPDYGLGAGQVTYVFNNHVEQSIGRFAPDIEVGYADTSNLVDRRIVKNYIAVGPMAHFQTGTSVIFPRQMIFRAHAYEELPLASNIVYSKSGRGKKKKITTATDTDPTEDNGFVSSLDIPLMPHVILSGFYTRSLRDHDDIGGFSFTFMVKATPRSVMHQ